MPRKRQSLNIAYQGNPEKKAQWAQDAYTTSHKPRKGAQWTQDVYTTSHEPRKGVRWIQDVYTSSHERYDVASTFMRRCINVLCPVGAKKPRQTCLHKAQTKEMQTNQLPLPQKGDNKAGLNALNTIRQRTGRTRKKPAANTNKPLSY